MKTHSSILAWEIPWTEEPGGLQSMGSQRIEHDWSDLEGTHAGNFFVHQSLRTNTGLNDILEEKSEYDIVFLKLYMKSIV